MSAKQKKGVGRNPLRNWGCTHEHKEFTTKPTLGYDCPKCGRLTECPVCGGLFNDFQTISRVSQGLGRGIQYEFPKEALPCIKCCDTLQARLLISELLRLYGKGHRALPKLIRSAIWAGLSLLIESATTSPGEEPSAKRDKKVPRSARKGKKPGPRTNRPSR